MAREEIGKLHRICVFCGSNPGRNPRYREAAVAMGAAIVDSGRILIYGGGRVGLMGVVADVVLAAGGHVIGVIPEFLATKEITHTGVTETHTVSSMHVRKAMMVDLADAFVALPGGLGTFDEFCEIISWAQLGLHSKPIGLLNVSGYFDGLIAQIDRAVADGLCRPEHRSLFLVDDDAPRLLRRFEDHRPPATTKWLHPGET